MTKHNDGIKRIASPESDEWTALYDLIQRYQDGRLQAPPHQRRFVWGFEKIKAWAETLAEAAESNFHSKPLGVMVTYQLLTNGINYLNDGFQRLNATMKIIENPTKWGTPYKTSQEWKEIAQSFKVMVQHRQYQSHTEAMYWFQVLSLGTALTAFEFSKGSIEYLEEEVNWASILQDLHDGMEPIVRGVTSLPKPDNLPARHTAMRHNYHLFYLWLSRKKDIYPGHAPVATKFLNLRDYQAGRMVEQRLGVLLTSNALGADANQRTDRVAFERKAFLVYIEQEAKVINNIWNEVLAGRDYRPSYTLFRWLLAVSIWKRNSHANQEDWLNFLRLIFHNSDTAGRVYKRAEDGSLAVRIVGLDKLSCLRELCVLLEFPPFITLIDQRREERKNQRGDKAA